MKNGEKVIIHQVTTDLMEVVIPYDVIQHGRDANPDSFGERIYFKQIKNVTVTYLSNSNGKESHIKLVHLKEVSEIDISSFMAQYYKRVGLLVSQTIGLLLLSESMSYFNFPLGLLPSLKLGILKRRARASDGQQYPLPCCTHFRFPKCVQ